MPKPVARTVVVRADPPVPRALFEYAVVTTHADTGQSRIVLMKPFYGWASPGFRFPGAGTWFPNLAEATAHARYLLEEIVQP